MDRVHTLADTKQFVYRDLIWIWSWIIFTTITVLGHRSVHSGYRTICVSGLGLDLVADHFYDYCTRTPDWICVLGLG